MNAVVSELKDFPYGQALDYPTPSEDGRPRRLCISDEHLQFVREAMENVSFKRWRRRPSMLAWHRPKCREPVVLTAVLSEPIGYIVFHWPRGEDPTILADSLAEIPLVFPTLADATLFAEAKLRGLQEAGIAVWAPVNDKLRL